VRALKTSPQSVARLAFSSCGTRLAAGGSGMKVCFWDITAAQVKPTTLRTFDGRSQYLAFLPNGKLFAVSTTGQYATFDPETDTDVRGKLASQWTGDLVPNADFTAFFGTGWQARKWAYDGAKLTLLWEQELPGELTCGGYCDGGALTAYGQYLAPITTESGRASLHSRYAETGRLLDVYRLASARVLHFTLFPESRTVAFIREKADKGTATNAVMLGKYFAKCDALVKAKAGEKDVYTALAVHPTGARLAVGCGDGTVRTFDVKSWRELTAHKWFDRAVRALAYAPSGLTAAAGSEGGAVVVWDAE
jgi:WD40 repeat protein